MSKNNTSNSKISPSLLKFPIQNRQPFKGIYIFSRGLSLFILIPAWSVYYSIPSNRGRKSWKVKECVFMRMVRWIMPLNAECGIAPASVDKTKGPATGTLKETSFIWMEPARDALVKGMAKDIKVKGVRVPGYVWPKGEKLEEGDGVVGLFIHGGGYMMGNGTEKFGELNIARLLNKRSKMKRILSVEYRLCGESCHPAQLLDGLAAYAHLVETLKIDSSRIVILGACAGGNLVMMLSRYLYEEKVLPLPGRLMLFSPVIDMAIDFEITQGMTKPRPNTEIDWLATSHLANVRFIGHHPPELAFSPYLSSNRAPPGSYTGYPPTFVSIGDAESLQQEVEQLVGLMKNDGVEITLDVQKDATHDFLAMDIVPSDSAREQAIQSACEWVDKIAVPST